MKRQFTASTRRLLQLVGWRQEPPDPPEDPDNVLYRIECDENHQLRRIAFHISNPRYFGLPAGSFADTDEED